MRLSLTKFFLSVDYKKNVAILGICIPDPISLAPFIGIL